MDRRNFLKTGGALALAGAVLPGCHRTVGAPYINIGKGSQMTLKWFPYELELAHTFTVASFSRKTTPDVQVEIEYDGFVGYGEASMPPYLGHTVESVCAFLEKVDLSRFDDPTRIEDIMEYVGSLSEGDAPAKAAVDIALHDLVGKLFGLPLYRLFGYNPEKAGDTTFTIGIDTPDIVREKTLEAADRFNILKVKVGLDTDKEMIESIRSVTQLPLAVDANQGWKDRSKALDEIFWLKENGVVMVEQPMSKDRLEDIAWITERSPLPIFADESVQGLKDVYPLKGIFSGINIKLMKCGGLLNARKMIGAAEACGLKVMTGCMTETSCACSAVAALAPASSFQDIDGNLLITNDRFTGGVRVVSGRLTLPDLPGLGLSVK